MLITHNLRTALLLFFTIVKVSGSNVAGTSCAIMNKKMYITGGSTSEGSSMSEFNNLVTVDLTKKFDISTFRLNDSLQVEQSKLPKEIQVPHEGAIFGEGVDGTKLWMFGGTNQKGKPVDQTLRYFDLDTKQYNDSVNLNTPPNRKSFGFIVHEGKFCVFGGKLTSNESLVNEYWRFHIKEGWWEQVSADISLPTMHHNQAVLFQSRYFVIMGGQDKDNKIRSLSELLIYDLQMQKWKIQSTTGGENHPIVKFMPIAYKDNIYIQGGANMLNTSHPDYKIYPGMMVLDTKSWSWKELFFNDKSGNPINTARAQYAAWLVGNQYAQFLGLPDSSNSNGQNNTFSEIQVFDLDKMILANEYIPPSDGWFAEAFRGDYGGGATDNTIPIAVGVSVGILVLLLVIGATYYRYRQKISRLEKMLDSTHDLPDAELELNPIWIESTGITKTPFVHNFNDGDNFQGRLSHSQTSYFKKDKTNMPNPKMPITYSLTSSQRTDSTNYSLSRNDELFNLLSQTVLPEESQKEHINSKFVS